MSLLPGAGKPTDARTPSLEGGSARAAHTDAQNAMPPFPVVCLIAIQQAAQTHGWDDTDTKETDR